MASSTDSASPPADLERWVNGPNVSAEGGSSFGRPAEELRRSVVIAKVEASCESPTGAMEGWSCGILPFEDVKLRYPRQQCAE